MPNSTRRLTPEPSDEERNLARNPNLPENDGAAAVLPIGGGRHRDENSLSFRHFLQQHSDVVPQPAPTRARSSRGPHAGTVDLVDVTMALPDFVQDHLIMESMVATGDHANDTPSRQLQHAGPPLDLNVLNEIIPDFSSSQRNPVRISHGPSRRRSGQDPHSSINGDNSHSHGSITLPDFLSDGPMQLNHNDASVNNSPSSSSTNRPSRSRPLLENPMPDEPVRGPSFESKESLRLEINRLRRELTEKNRRLNQLEMELARSRSSSGTSETSMRAAEKNVTDANKRAAEAEKHVLVLNKELSRLRIGNGHAEAGGTGSSSNSSGIISSNGLESPRFVNANAVLNVARSSEILISQLMHQIEELKRMAVKAEAQSHGERSKGKDTAKKSHQ